MKRNRLFAVLAVALLAVTFSSCTRSVGDDLSQKGSVIQRDANHVYDTFSKYFLNHDPDDPYLD